jgi:hypothetical protein
MHWLDSVVATPTIGCLFENTFKSSHEHLTALRPLLQEWNNKYELKIANDQPMTLGIQKGDGFSYTIEQDKLGACRRNTGEWS